MTLEEVAERIEHVRNEIDPILNLALAADARRRLLAVDKSLQQLKKEIGYQAAGLCLAAHREGPATADRPGETKRLVCPHCRKNIALPASFLANAAHREGRPPAAEKLEVKDDDEF